MSAREPEPRGLWTTERAFLRVGSVRMEVGRWVKLRTIKEALFFSSFPPLNTTPLVKCLKWDKAKPLFHVAILKYSNVSSRLRRSFLVFFPGKLSVAKKKKKTVRKQNTNFLLRRFLCATIKLQCRRLERGTWRPLFGVSCLFCRDSVTSELQRGRNTSRGFLSRLPLHPPSAVSEDLRIQWLYLLCKQAASCFGCSSGFPAAGWRRHAPRGAGAAVACHALRVGGAESWPWDTRRFQLSPAEEPGDSKTHKLLAQWLTLTPVRKKKEKKV